MKTTDIVATAVANTFRSKLRTTLTIVAIFIGAFTLTITSAIGTGVNSYITTQVASIGATNVLTVSKTADSTTTTTTGPAKYDASKTTTTAAGPPGTSTEALTDSDITTISKLSGVTKVTPAVSISPAYIEYSDNGKYVPTINAQASLTKPDLAAGTALSSSSTENQILLPSDWVKSLGFSSNAAAVGKTVTLGIADYTGTMHEVTATVVGIQNETLLGSGAGLGDALQSSLETVQNTGKPDSITTSYSSATATFASDATSTEISTIKSELKDAGYTGTTVADQLGSFETVINGVVYVLDAFAVIALIAAGFGIINTLLMSVQERTREIGLMKAMGMGGSRVFALFSLEAVFIGFLGSALGAVIGIGLGSVISAVLSRTVLSTLPGLHLLQFSPTSIAVIVGVVMLIAFLAGTLPARRASRQNPIEALRYE